MITKEQFHEPRWTIGQIAKAIGISTNTLNTWAHKAPIRSETFKQSRGLPTLFSTFAAFEFAVMAVLNRNGVQREFASLAGKMFAHTGRGPSGWAGEPSVNQVRDPSGVYPNGSTWLVASQSKSVVRILPDEEIVRAIKDLGGDSDPVLVFQLNKLHDELPRRLDDISTGLIR